MEREPDPTAPAWLRRLVSRAARDHAVPGMAVGLLHEGREHVVTTGVTSLGDPLPVTPDTLFMVGSTTKTLTATAVMRLVERGDLALDDRVVDRLPGFRLGDMRAARRLTLRHLLTHTGGFDGDIATDTGWGDDALARYVAALAHHPQQLPPGKAWSYSNAGFSIAGRLLEVATGTTYEAAVTDLVLAPLRMRTSFFSPVDAFSRRTAVGHLDHGSGPEVAHLWGLPRALAPAGGLLSSVRDQLTWARFHLGDGRLPGRSGRGSRLLRAATIRLMQSELAPAGTLADAVGTSWLLADRGGVRTVGHGGNVSNLQISTFTMVPGAGLALTVLTNATGGRAASTVVESSVLARLLGVSDELPAPLDPVPDSAAYCGSYRAEFGLLEVRPLRGGLLELRSRVVVDSLPDDPEERRLLRRALRVRPPALTLALVAPDRAVVVEGPAAGTRAEFLRTSAGLGPMEWCRWGGRLHRRVG